jgi:WD40 repeat protein
LNIIALPIRKETCYTSVSSLNLFYRPHLGQGRRVCKGQRIHGSLIPQARKKYKSHARHWKAESPQAGFAELIQTEAHRYLDGKAGRFWEIDDYERARIFLWAIGLGGPPEHPLDETKPPLEPQSNLSEFEFSNVPVLTTRISDEWKMFCQRIIDVLTKTRDGTYNDQALGKTRKRVEKMPIPPLIAYSELRDKSPVIQSLLRSRDKSDIAHQFMKVFTFLKIDSAERLRWATLSRSGDCIASAHYGIHTWRFEQELIQPVPKHQIYLWTASDGSELGYADDDDWTVNVVAFTPDGSMLASCGSSGVIKLWEVPSFPSGSASHVSSSLALTRKLQPSGESFLSRELRSQLCWVSFSEDGSQLVVTSGKPDNVYIWNIKSGESDPMVLDGHVGMVDAASFSFDGRQVISASQDTDIHVWDLQHEGSFDVLDDNSTGVMGVAITRDSKQIASGANDGTIMIWEERSHSHANKTQWKLRKKIRAHSRPITRVSFSPNGHWLISGGWDGDVKIWNVATGEMDAKFEGHTDSEVQSVEFSWDGKHIMSASEDGVIALWYSERYCKPVSHRLSCEIVVLNSTASLLDQRLMGSPLQGRILSLTLMA